MGLAGDRGLEVVTDRTDWLAGRRVAHFLEIFEMAVRVPGLALGCRAGHGRDIVEALDLSGLGQSRRFALPRFCPLSGYFRKCLSGVEVAPRKRSKPIGRDA